jgi:hypothetical protein
MEFIDQEEPTNGFEDGGNCNLSELKAQPVRFAGLLWLKVLFAGLL